MSHIHPSGETQLRPPFRAATSQRAERLSQASLGIDRYHLRAVIAERRAAPSAVEIEMVTKCERAAVRLATRNVRLDDRGTWDRAMWNRYLSTAAALELDYMPQMLRPQAEIGQLDQILLLAKAPEACAA